MRRRLIAVGTTLVCFVSAGSSGSLAYGAAPYEDPHGSQLWAARFNDPLDASDTALALAVSPTADTVYVTGSAEGRRGYGYTTLAYRVDTGQLRWVARFGRGYDQAIAITVSSDGTRVFVTGYSSKGFTRSRDYGTVAYDAATGEQLWSAIYGSALGDDGADRIAVSPDDATVFVSGFSQLSRSLVAPTVVAYDAVSGAELWVASAPVDGNSFGLGVSPDGTLVYETGECCGAKDDYFTIALDAHSGAEVWRAEYDGPGHGQDAPMGLVVAPDGGRIFVTGLSVGLQHYEYATVAYDATSGDELWVSRYDGHDHKGGFGYAIGIIPDGSVVYATGEVLTQLSAYGTVAYDAATGDELWERQYHSVGAGYNVAHALAVAPDASGLYVTGVGQMNSSTAFQTVAYDPSTGELRWVATYFGPDKQEDDAYSIGVTPDGEVVFVTGRSYGPANADYATVAYQA